MLVLFSLFALGANGDGNEQCYGKTIEDYGDCALAGDDDSLCAKNDKCAFGKTPKMIMSDVMEKCVKDHGEEMFKECRFDYDCLYWECDSMCIDGTCKGCANMQKKSSCKTAIDDGIWCKWSPATDSKNKDDGVCVNDANCYAKELVDYYKCLQHKFDPKPCLADPKCMWGMDPVAKQLAYYDDCLYDCGGKLRGKDFYFKECETTEDCCAFCSTGQICLRGMQMDAWEMEGKMCMGCHDMVIKADCEAGAAGGLQCIWSPGEGDAGTCVSPSVDPTFAPTTRAPTTLRPSRTPTIPPSVTPSMQPTLPPKCAEYTSKQACKEAPLCRYKRKKCMENFEPECVGRRMEVHHKCFHIATKVECEFVTDGKKPLCFWGKNELDLDAGVMECLEERKVAAPVKCTSHLDCSCGQECFEMFGAKSCSSCRDMGNKKDCDAMTLNSELACKFLGTDEDGLCIQVDTCRDYDSELFKCKYESLRVEPPPKGRIVLSTCEFNKETNICSKIIATKKKCKVRGSVGSVDEQDELKKECEALRGCVWSSASRKGKRGRCSLGKKK